MMSEFKILTFDELSKELDKYTFKQLHIHHTWKPAHSSFTGKNHIQLQQSMKNHHVKNNGWADIGQHLTLFPDGAWVTGRPFNMSPASISGWNTGALAVEMLGNFDLPGTGEYNNLGYDKLEGKQKEEILKLIRYFIDKYGEKSIVFHREGPKVTKTCPGTSLNKQELINEAKLLGKDGLNMGSVFKDVDDNRWSAPYIKAAKELDIIAGNPDGTFNPTGNLTREQAAVLMVRLYEKITGKKVVK